MKNYLAISAVLFLSSAYAANEKEIKPSTEVIEFVINCKEALNPNASTHLVNPAMLNGEAQVPATRDSLDRHKHGMGFSFSQDGKYVAITHSGYPGAEQMSVRSLETAENLASLYWRGQGDTLFSVYSSDFDGESKRIVGLANNFFTDRTDVVLSWDGSRDSLIEKVNLSPMTDKDFSPTTTLRNMNETYYSPISLQHPYYIRTYIRHIQNEKYGPMEYSAQIVDWQNKKVLNLTEASTQLSKVNFFPISSEFRYIAILEKGEKTIQLHSFDSLAKKMSVEKPKGLLGQTVLALTSRLSSIVPRQELAGVAPFSAALTHDEEVIKAVNSKWAPFIVTQTKLGLHIWNAKTGQLISKIEEPVQSFRVLDKMGLVAYVSNQKLVLYSLMQGRPIGSAVGFNHHYLPYYLENYQRGLAYVTLHDGTILKVTEAVSAETGQPTYEMTSTNIKLEIPLIRSSRTEIKTEKSKYLVQISERRDQNHKKDLILEVYQLDGSGKKVLELSYPVNAFQSEFGIDPNGQKIVYTASELTTGILHLDRILKEKGL